MGLAVEIITRESELGWLRGEWDELAVQSQRPFCCPAWMLAWWRNVAPEDAALRIFAVTEDERLVGIAPFWVADGEDRHARYEILAGGLSPPTGPLAAPGMERAVAEALADALHAAAPRPSHLRLEDVTGNGSLTDALVEAWPKARPWIHSAPPSPLPVVSIEGLGYEDWLAGRSSKFRQESRRIRRRLEDAEARFVLAGPEDLDRGLRAFAELHGARWEDRGGSNALVPGLEQMLKEAGAELCADRRLRMFTIEAEGKVIAVNILVAAGGEVSGWNSGFDQSWSRLSPSMQLTLHAIADAAERGDRRLGLGPGEGSYKSRLADTQEEVALLTIVPHGPGYWPTRLRLVRHQIRWWLSRRLSHQAKLRLRRLVRR